jgi:hypothetical protein
MSASSLVVVFQLRMVIDWYAGVPGTGASSADIAWFKDPAGNILAVLQN